MYFIFVFLAYEFTPGPGDTFAAAQYGIVFLESDGGTKIKLRYTPSPLFRCDVI